jgi:sarcosine oxidase subunit alpha
MSGRHADRRMGRIDRSQLLRFTFNGRAYIGHRGDTLASALIANGVRLVARSFKYHRPRGLVAAGPEEPNALVQLGTGARTEPNLLATQIELEDGLVASSVNVWPSVDFDLGRINDMASKILTAGFYYKTFMHPQSLWMRVYEPAIRRMAGMGKAPTAPDPDVYDRMYQHCEVLVIGGGPAGLAAARAAAPGGGCVILADEQVELGGDLLSRAATIEGAPAADWVEDSVAALRAAPEVRLLTRTTAFGVYDHGYVCLIERRPGRASTRQRVWHIRAKQIVLATGSHERPLVFADNDRPGVMLAGAVRTYANRYAALAGERAVVFTNNDSAYAAAFDLHAAGIDVPAIVDLRATAPEALAANARALGIEVLAGWAVTRTRGTKSVTGVDLRAMTGDGAGTTGPLRRIACDLVAMSGGWSPAVHLFSQAQGKLRFDEAQACFVPQGGTAPVLVAGAARGSFDLASCLAEGHAAGLKAAGVAGGGAPRAEAVSVMPLRPLWTVPSDRPIGHGAAKHFVDLQNDVTAADIRLAAREGYRSVEHAKRYTTAGMGTDQGKTSNVNALAVLAEATGSAIPAVGTTTFRPPYTPVAFGALAARDVGDLADPVRTTAIHPWHEAHGAVYEDVGQWKRPWYFPCGAEDMHAAVRRECIAAREAVAVLDASTLGKIDIKGPDAAEFLERVYTNPWKGLGIGRCRYGLMCREDGMVFDDGVTTRLAENHFYMTTTTGGAARVLDWLEEYSQTEWPELKVHFTSVTEQWATAAVVGPKAREVVAALAPDLALDDESFPFMAMREAKIAGMEARIFRISFSGELSYEINVAAHYGLSLWEMIMAVGQPHGITPYGTETMHVLRAEKGFIIVGQETDGTVTPLDLGMEWIIGKKKPDFIGKRSLARADALRPDRKQLVGLLTVDPAIVLPEGAQIVAEASTSLPVPMLGYVTSAYSSAAAGRSIALALVKGGRMRKGESLVAYTGDRYVPVTVCDPVFYDVEGRKRG